MAKLVEILAREVHEWPKDAEYAVQDGDRRQTIKYGKTKGNLGVRAEGHSLDVWQNRSWGFTSNYDFDHAELASDFMTAVVTQKQWQAERDRQKGGEWKRHRGGKQPVFGGKVEVKFRDGDVEEWFADSLCWDHGGKGRDIMKYKVISQPQAEEPMKAKFDGVKLEFSRDGVNFSEIGTARIDNICDFVSTEAKTDQIDGPIKWRDTIIHCQAIIEDCEREIQRNVDLLDAEGLMMQTDSKKAMQHYVAPAILPIEEWQVGDIIEVIRESSESCAEAGRQYPITDIDDVDPRYELDGTYYPLHSDMKFIRRP